LPVTTCGLASTLDTSIVAKQHAKNAIVASLKTRDLDLQSLMEAEFARLPESE